MQCPSCHEPVAIWAAFCPHCGVSMNEAQDAPETTESLTSELFGGPGAAAVSEPVVTEPLPTAVPTEAVPVGTVPPEEAAPVAPPAASAPSQAERSGASGATALMVAASVIIAAALGFAAWSILRVGADDASNSPTAATTTSPRPSASGTSAAPTTPAPSSATASPSASATPSASTTPDGAVPAGAIACGVTGEGDTAAVYSANANTSCPFAQEVANVFRASGGASTFTAHSPVTGKDYVMTCSGTLPTTCVANTGATVYLTKG